MNSIRDEIDKRYREFKMVNNKQPTILYMDAFYLAQLSEELGYNDHDYMDNIHNLTNYQGMKLELLEDSNDVIQIV